MLAASSSTPVAGRSAQASDGPTPRSRMPAAVQCTTWTGMASTTSLAMIAPRKFAGSRSICRTRSPSRSRWRHANRRSSRGSVFTLELAGQHIGERAAPGAEFEDTLETFQLARQRAPEERGRAPARSIKAAVFRKLLCAARVVADAGLVQRELHVALEADPAAGPGNFLLDARARLHGLEFKALMPESLDGRVALVTGGARRVGAAIVRRLHAAGAAVLVHYRDSDADAAKLVAEGRTACGRKARRT